MSNASHTRRPSLRVSRNRATISSHIWYDPEWRCLTPEAQWLAFVLASHHHDLSPLTFDELGVSCWPAINPVEPLRELFDGGFVEHGTLRWLRLDLISPLNRRAAHRPHIPEKVRTQVYERDGFTCVTCGSADDLTLDHIHPYSRGGLDTFDNLQTMCRPCNSRKGARCPG